jgi:hypothetical protein
MSVRSGYRSTGRVSASWVCAALRPRLYLCLRLYRVRPQPLRTQKPSHCLYLRLRLSVSGVHRTRRRRRLPCGVGPRVGTPKPTSPLRRRRHYLATLRVSGAQKYADRPAAALGPDRTDSGRFGRVSFKGSQSKDHSGWRRALGLRFGCNPGSAAKVHSNEPLPDCG